MSKTIEELEQELELTQRLADKAERMASMEIQALSGLLRKVACADVERLKTPDEDLITAVIRLNPDAVEDWDVAIEVGLQEARRGIMQLADQVRKEKAEAEE